MARNGADATTNPDRFLLSVRAAFQIYRENDIETVALRGVDFDIARGEFVAIQGRSGAGKTTLLNLIGGLNTPSAGQIILEGRDMARMDETERAVFRRQHIGIVFQTGNLIPFLTALENVIVPMTWSGVSSHRARIKATELLTDLRMGDRLHHRVGHLSGGEAQRVGIAIGLANGPDLLLADELTGELDSVTTDHVMDALQDMLNKSGMTLLVVTHNNHVAARAERVMHITDGIIEPERNHA